MDEYNRTIAYLAVWLAFVVALPLAFGHVRRRVEDEMHGRWNAALERVMW